MDTFRGNTAHMSDVYNQLLFFGSQYATRDDTLSKRSIRHIISIACKPLNKYVATTNHFFDIEDKCDVDNVVLFFDVLIPQMHAIIDKCIQLKEPVLVHCQAGQSRSAAVIISWIMKQRLLSYDEAFTFVKQCRQATNPNPAFITMLTKYIK